MAGLPDMKELSLLQANCGKQFAKAVSGVPTGESANLPSKKAAKPS
jgi:hypothetical protein